MNDTTPTGVMRRPRPPTARTAAAIIAAAALALLAAACGGSGSSAGSDGASSAGGSSSSSTSARLLAFSRCMHSHGVPQFPDPEPGQTEIKLPGPNQGAYGVSGSQIWSAVRPCRHLLPSGVGAWYPRSDIPRVLRAMREFARCMRSHGISQWPDPSFDSQGRLAFFGPGADNPPGSPTDHAMNQCSYLAPLGANTDFLGG
jgi:hypothetical protein